MGGTLWVQVLGVAGYSQISQTFVRSLGGAEVLLPFRSVMEEESWFSFFCPCP